MLRNAFESFQLFHICTISTNYYYYYLKNSKHESLFNYALSFTTEKKITLLNNFDVF